MSPSFIALIAGLVIASATFGFGVRVGQKIEQNTTLKADLKHSNLVRVRQETIIREVPKIVTKVVTKEVTVEKEVERVIVASQHLLAPDCLLPDNYGMLLVAAARGLNPDAAGRVDETAGEYGCREVLAATLSDLKAGWQNSARLAGLQQFTKLVTSP